MLLTDAMATGELADLLSAHDTLLLCVDSSSKLEQYLGGVSEAGQQYGMELHRESFSSCLSDRMKLYVDPTVLLSQNTLGVPGKCACGRGRRDTDFARRTGMAASDFRSLAKVWKHA